MSDRERQASKIRIHRRAKKEARLNRYWRLWNLLWETSPEAADVSTKSALALFHLVHKDSARALLSSRSSSSSSHHFYHRRSRKVKMSPGPRSIWHIKTPKARPRDVTFARAFRMYRRPSQRLKAFGFWTVYAKNALIWLCQIG